MFKRKEEGGISLLEVIAVIAIIGILASIAIAGYSVYRERALETQKLTELKSLALEISDTRERTMTPAGYAQTYSTLTADEIKKNADTEQFKVIQYWYQGDLRRIVSNKRDLSDATPDRMKRDKALCVTIAKGKDPVSDSQPELSMSVIIDGTAKSGKTFNSTCPPYLSKHSM